MSDTHAINETHDSAATSWVASAQAAGGDFPLQNLPYAAFKRRGSGEPLRIGVAIGDAVLDLSAVQQAGGLGEAAAAALAAAQGESLNALMALGRPAWRALRLALFRALKSGSPDAARLAPCLVPQAEVVYGLPVQVGDYTDFYTSIHHATNVGKLFRPDNPLLPNYRWVPIGYHGRASTLVVSGTPVVRPHGQLMPPGAEAPTLAPCKRLDYELELALLMGRGNAMGEAIPIERAEEHVFGVTLLNDWSARDVQGWEYQPLGPFLAKNFATTLSPWVVTMEALAPYRVPFTRAAGEPAPLPYLDSPANRAAGALDVQLAVTLASRAMREAGTPAAQLCRTSWRHAYWTAAQMVAHHSVNGCAMRAGDVLGTGTLSGPTASEAGALLELSVGGKQPISLPSGESRTFLEDGDVVTLAAWCERPGAARIGFGSCAGEVLPARG